MCYTREVSDKICFVQNRTNQDKIYYVVDGRIVDKNLFLFQFLILQKYLNVFFKNKRFFYKLP